MARDERVIIRLRADVKEEFQRLADDMGMTISALGSYVIGKFVTDHKRNRELQEKMVAPAVNELIKMISDDASKSLEVAQVFDLMSGQIKKTVEGQNSASSER
jgi:antitoxin component of RelBE/YafQ-DinJ toxin-antitoxin module